MHMFRKREPCRNFQRGSCQYGDRCKFLHATQQQTKPNPFGFGTQNPSHLSQANQQSQPSPFGFGVQSSSQLVAATNLDSRSQNPSKPFENKWIRPTASVNSASSQQSNVQKQASAHECTDPESCKRQIVEDFKNEAPLWKLTCYGHCKHLPCDVGGDFSYEELRVNAYEDAKRGLSLQSIVQRERNLLNSKIAEFDNLLVNPYVIRRPGPVAVNQFSVISNTLPVSPISSPPAVTSFSLNSAAPALSFGNQISGTPLNTVFGQATSPANPSHFLGGSEMKLGDSGTFGKHLQMQQFGSSSGPINHGRTDGILASQQPLKKIESTSGPINFGNTNAFKTMEREQLPLHSITQPFISSSSIHSLGIPDEAKVGQSAVNQTPSMNKKDLSADDAVWSKEWDIGEIPEEEPPESVCIDIKYQTHY